MHKQPEQVRREAPPRAALAAGSGTGLHLAEALLRSKLQGQQAVLDRLQADGYARRVFANSIDRLETAESPQS
jgi:hypothetical protein